MTNNQIGQFTDELEQTAEEVGGEVKDSVGQAIEQGIQSISGTQLDPQQIKQKRQEDQKKLAYTRKWISNLTAAQQKVREEDKQKKLQKQQLEEQQKEKKKLEQQQKKKVIISPAKKTPPVSGQPVQVEQEEIARIRQESGKGHGIGG